MTVDHTRAPVLEALDDYRRQGRLSFTPPGHKQARGADPAVREAAGRVAAEMVTPYPPGIPAVLPGERLTEPVLRCLTTGLAAGMNLPDPSDPGLETIRVPAADRAGAE